MLEEEIGSAMYITSLAWKRTPLGDPSSSFDDMKIYLGLCDSDVLGTDFESNYVPGTKTLVFSEAPFTISAGADEWAVIELDTPFWYNGQDNLIVEVTWPDGAGTFYVYRWATGSDRTLEAPYGSSTGMTGQEVPHMQLIGDLGLDGCSFGRLKVSF
ncbi:hypothetical protein JW921_07295 [Candidatus Fermentibacterales bacterium]|nr:hypothetical protein [Candidatus Fermentibacterales bacterium]